MINISDVLKNAIDLKPSDLYISELKWRYLLRSGYRGKNILLVGPRGCGKTLAAFSLVKAMSDVREDVVTEDELEQLKSRTDIDIEIVKEITES